MSDDFKSSQAPAFFSGDPRASKGGKAKKKNRIGRETALATCRRMNFDGFESLILFAQGNTEALDMEPGEITGSMRLNAVKETLTYVMTKKQEVTLAPDSGTEGGGAMQIMVVAPNNSATASVLELDDKNNSTITMDMSEIDMAEVARYDDGILSEGISEELEYIDID